MMTLLTQWRFALPLAVILLVAASLIWQRHRIHALQGDVTTAQARAIVLEGATRAQSSAIANWKKTAELQSARVRQTQLAAARASIDAMAQAQGTLAADIPVDCGEGVAWASKRAQELSREWSRP